MGGTWSHDQINTSATNLQLCTFCGNQVITAQASAQGTAGVFSGNNGGFIGGGQLGYNWQFNSWVAGFEADIQGIGDHRNIGVGGTIQFIPPVIGSGVSMSTSMALAKEVDWLGTVRGRLGWLATPSLLVYGTGGLAYGEVKASTSISQAIIPPVLLIKLSLISAPVQAFRRRVLVGPLGAVSSGCSYHGGRLNLSISTMILAA